MNTVPKLEVQAAASVSNEHPLPSNRIIKLEETGKVRRDWRRYAPDYEKSTRKKFRVGKMTRQVRADKVVFTKLRDVLLTDCLTPIV